MAAIIKDMFYIRLSLVYAFAVGNLDASFGDRLCCIKNFVHWCMHVLIRSWEELKVTSRESSRTVSFTRPLPFRMLVIHIQRCGGSGLVNETIESLL